MTMETMWMGTVVHLVAKLSIGLHANRAKIMAMGLVFVSSHAFKAGISEILQLHIDPLKTVTMATLLKMMAAQQIARSTMDGPVQEEILLTPTFV